MRELALATKTELELLTVQLRAEQPNLTDNSFERLAASYLRTLDQFIELLVSDDSLKTEFYEDLVDAHAEIKDLSDVRKALIRARMHRLNRGAGATHAAPEAQAPPVRRGRGLPLVGQGRPGTGNVERHPEAR